MAQVPAEPRRIVVLSGDQLDALCALGLQSRVVGAALPDGSSSEPSYLGSALHGVPNVGTRSSPDVGAIAAAHPDLILGSAALTPKLYSQLAGIAPTVFTGAPGAAWQDNLRGVGAAVARSAAVDALLGGFGERAAQVGAKHDAAHFQASIVQLTENTMRVYGTKNFPASVLVAVGVDRPASQRFTDKAYIEFGTTDADLAKSPDWSAADADIIYVSCTSSAVAEHAASRLRTAIRGAGWPPTATTGSSSSTTRYGRPVRVWSPPAASSTTCAGSTRRSTSCGPLRRGRCQTGSLTGQPFGGEFPKLGGLDLGIAGNRHFVVAEEQHMARHLVTRQSLPQERQKLSVSRITPSCGTTQATTTSPSVSCGTPTVCATLTPE